MDGTWSSQDLTQVFAILAQNPELTDGFDRGWSQVAARAASRFHEKRRNSPGGSQQNIADHYDLGNALFDLFSGSINELLQRIFQFRPMTHLIPPGRTS